MNKIVSTNDLSNKLLLEDMVIYFKTNNCGVCDVMYPIIEEIALKYNVDIYTVNIENFPEIKGQYMVFTVPTVLIFNNGKEMLRESRFINHNNIDKYFRLRFR